MRFTVNVIAPEGTPEMVLAAVERAAAGLINVVDAAQVTVIATDPTPSTTNRIEELNAHTFKHLYPELTEDQRCDAALARDLLQMDGECIELDSWRSARDFIWRVLIRHGLQHPQDIYVTEDEYADVCTQSGTRIHQEGRDGKCVFCGKPVTKDDSRHTAAREDLGPDASPDTVRWLVEQRANIAQHSREE